MHTDASGGGGSDAKPCADADATDALGAGASGRARVAVDDAAGCALCEAGVLPLAAVC